MASNRTTHRKLNIGTLLSIVATMLDRRAAMLVLFSCFLFSCSSPRMHSSSPSQPPVVTERVRAAYRTRGTPCWHSSKVSPGTLQAASTRGSETVIAASRTAAGGEASGAATELADQPDLVGQVSPLLALDHLELLDLSENELEGPTGHIPKFLGSLKYLNLSGILLSRASPKFSQRMHESKCM